MVLSVYPGQLGFQSMSRCSKEVIFYIYQEHLLLDSDTNYIARQSVSCEHLRQRSQVRKQRLSE